MFFILSILLITLASADTCSFSIENQLDIDPEHSLISVSTSKNFLATKPPDFGEVTEETLEPLMYANITGINLFNQKNNIHLLGVFGDLSNLFKFSTPYGFWFKSFQDESGTTKITAIDGQTQVLDPGILKTKVFSISPAMDGNSSVVYNARGFPESEFELKAPMVTFGFYGNFSYNFKLPVSNYAYSTCNGVNIREITFKVTTGYNSPHPITSRLKVTYKGDVYITKNATLWEYDYTYVPFLALTQNIPMKVFPKLSYDWTIQPFGVSGSYFIFSPYNVLGQKKCQDQPDKCGEVTIKDVAIGLIYSWLRAGASQQNEGGLTKEKVIAGIKNLIYHTYPVVEASKVGGNEDEAKKAAEGIERMLNSYSSPPHIDDFDKAKQIAAAGDPRYMGPLRQKYLLDPFVFNGSEMLIASYLNSSSNKHQLYELWYINTTTYAKPKFYYRDSFNTELLAVGGAGNKVFTLEKKDNTYNLKTYEIVPIGYKLPSSQLPTTSETRNLERPFVGNNENEKKRFFTQVYNQANQSWIKFFGETIYEETHDLYKVSSIQIPNYQKILSFTVDKYTNTAYLLLKGGAYMGSYSYFIFNSNGENILIPHYTGDFENAKMAALGNILFISSSKGEIHNYVISKNEQGNNELKEIGSPIPLSYNDLNISLYAKYAYESSCKSTYPLFNVDNVRDKPEYHNVLAMAAYNGFIYLVDHWTIRQCGIDEVRLRIISIGNGTDLVINPFDKNDRIKCVDSHTCGNSTIAPPYGWVLASTRKDKDKYSFYPSSDEKFGFPEIGAPIGDGYAANMSMDDLGRIYLVTSSSKGKSVAIIDLQPYNYTVSTFGAGSLYSCISNSDGSSTEIIIEKKGIGTRKITQNPKCYSSEDVDKIIYLYGAPNVIELLNQLTLPVGLLYSGAGIAVNEETISKGMSLWSSFYEESSQKPPQVNYKPSPATLTSSVGGGIALPFYSLYLFNQTANIAYGGSYESKWLDNPLSCDNLEQTIKNNAPPSSRIQHYPGGSDSKLVEATYTFSEALVPSKSEDLTTMFESTNMVYVIYSIINGTVLPTFFYQKSLPQQPVSLSLFQIFGFGSRRFGEAYLNISPTSSYGEPVTDENSRSPIAKVRNYCYRVKLWKYNGEILNATGLAISRSKPDTDLSLDYYFNPAKVDPSAVDNFKTELKLGTESTPLTFTPTFPYVLNRKAPLISFVTTNLAILTDSEKILGRRKVNLTFVDLFNTTFNLPMKLDFAYSTKINATLNISLDKTNKDLTHVTIKGNLSKIVYNKETQKLEYIPLAGKIYVYVDRNINYCSKKNIFYSGQTYIPACSKNLAEDNPPEAIKCSILKGKDCLLANPLNFTETGASMEPIADTINYKAGKPEEEKYCNIYGDTYPATCEKQGYYCLPIYPNGTGFCTSQIGLVTILDANGNFKYDFDIYGFGLGEKVILQYYGYPSFAKDPTTNTYVENYAYMPTTTVLSLNYGVLPLDFGKLSLLPILLTLSVLLLFIIFKNREKFRKIFI